MNKTGSYTEIVGCIHIHSVYSDGTGTIPEIASFAAQTGLDFIMITDHHHLRALKNGEERWYGPVLALVGYEINDVDDRNHYLAFGLNEEVEKNLPAASYVRRVKENGGFGIIAHPDEQRDVLPEHPPYPWTAWDSEDFAGIEIWNQMSEWMEGLSPWNKLWRFVNPRKSIIAPMDKTLERWDRINLHRRVVGIGGIDAHAHKHKLLGGLVKVTIFHYKVQFKSVRTHLLLSRPIQPGMDVPLAKQQVYEALLASRVFVSNYFNGDARGFRFRIENDDTYAEMGESIHLSPGSRLLVRAPEKGKIRVIHNGVVSVEKESGQAEFPIHAPGLYRVEVYRKNRAWIYSNHIRVHQ